MSRVRPIEGACNCGRIHYSIVVPIDATEQAQVYFDDSSVSRRSQATPLTAWLRVPLGWYASHTTAHFPDETHNSIRRKFTPLHEPHCERVFCGYCGTHLSYWTEEPSSESDYIKITLGSLLGRDIRALQELDLLPETEDFSEVQAHDQENLPIASTTPASDVQQVERQGRTGDLAWFEEMIDGSRLGHTHKKRRGVGVSADGNTTVQWEITEEHDDDTEQETLNTGSKRKIGQVNDENDVTMNE